MKNKIRKILNKKGFTLAELLVLMSVLTVIFAAVAPIFTSRYSDAALDNVWSAVGASNNGVIYNNTPTKTMSGESFIGITPMDLEDIRSTYRPYSKVVIRSGNKVNGDIPQKQIEFRNNGNRVGYLFGGNYNLLLGGEYSKMKISTYNRPTDNDNPMNFNHSRNDATGNTSMGIDALDSIQKGSYNTAFGYNALNALNDNSKGDSNTAIGLYAASHLKKGEENVFIGITSATGEGNDNTKSNTIISNRQTSSGFSNSSIDGGVTSVGQYVKAQGEYNTSIGYNSTAAGKYNTAVGAYSMYNTNINNSTSLSGSQLNYITAIGYNSCRNIPLNARNITCVGSVGYNSSNLSNTAKKLLSDSTDKSSVFIGPPVTKYQSAATLEIHNSASSEKTYPYNDIELGKVSVVVNGNLIVRGQTYMLGRSPFPMAPNTTSNANTPSLMGFRLYKEAKGSGNNFSTHKPFIGFDGSEKNIRITKDIDATKTSAAASYLRQVYSGREHCICSYSCNKNDKTGLTSYDWSKVYSDNYVFFSPFDGYDYYYKTSNKCGTAYNINGNNAATYNNVELDRAHGIFDDSGANSSSCCPILTNNGARLINATSASDRRLKKVGGEFNSGLKVLSKLKIYNYTFKSDKFNIPYVGVIAQDLKQIFPNAVTKDENGYYKIRWDEMFYTAINSIKELDQKVVKLAQDVENNISRINKLKKDNEKLEQRILKLSKELDSLEK